MRAEDLKIITILGGAYPELLEQLMMIYKLGYKQGQIDAMKRDISRFENKMNEVCDINYGSEMQPSN